MSATVFYPRLNEFCRKYLVTGVKLTAEDILAVDSRSKEIEAEIFENFLLFDKVSFKVFGENIPLVILLKYFGVKRIEELVEQDAIEFVLWTPMILTLVDNVKGVDALASGVHNSKAHSDPEESLELGFRWMTQQPKRSERRALIRKLRDIYRLPNSSLPHDTAAFIKSGFHGGKLSAYGLDPKEKQLDSLSDFDKKKLSSCAEDLLEYSYILSNQLTSISKSEYFNFFCDSKRKIAFSSKTSQAFNEISRIEDFPDLKSLYSKIEKPYEKVVSVRKKRASVKFRKWLRECSGDEGSVRPITLDYVQAIAEPSGFFQTWPGKFTKTIITSAMGGAIGHFSAGPIGAAVGVTAAKFVEPVIEPVIDMVDDYLLDGLTKGWTPRLFVDALRRFETKKD